MNSKVIASLFILGLSFGMGPCFISCGPLLISYIAGAGKNIPRATVAYLLFSLARILVYLVLGVLFFLLSRFLLEGFLSGFSRFIYIAGGVFVVLTGVAVSCGINFTPARFKTNIFILGVIIGLIPCGPLLSVLGYIGLAAKTWPQSLVYSLSFGFGTFISPLLALSIFAGAMPQFILKKQAYLRILNFICGGAIIFLGIRLIVEGAIKNA